MNSYSQLNDEELMRVALSTTPNKDVIKRKIFELFSRAIWKTPNPSPADLEHLQKELNEFFEELIAHQEGLGASIVAVNRLNRDLYTSISK